MENATCTEEALRVKYLITEIWKDSPTSFELPTILRISENYFYILTFVSDVSFAGWWRLIPTEWGQGTLAEKLTGGR